MATNRDFAGYRIVRPLELSPRASVWEAERLDSGDAVAIETLAGEAARDADVREWFAEAWGAVAEIVLPGVVGVSELGEQEGVPFAVRTPASGTTLARRISVHGPLEPAAAVALLRRLAAALDACHDTGVVHGTLGAGCVIVGSENDVDARLSGFGRAEGDRREDLRDLGAILATMLGGERAASGTGAAVEEAGDPRAALEEVLARSRNDGYSSAAELAAAATAAIGDQEAGAGFEAPLAAEHTGAATTGDDAGDEAPPRRLLPALVALAVVIAGILIVVGGGDDDSTPGGSGGGDEPTATTPAPIAGGGDSTGAEPDAGVGAPPPITVKGFPVGVAARDSTVYVTTRESGKLLGFDQTFGDRTIGPVDLGAAAKDVTVVEGVAWVTLPGSDQVARVDLEPDEPVVERLDVGADPTGLVAAYGSIWVADQGSGELSRIPLDGSEVKSVALEKSGPRSVAFGMGSLWISHAGGTVTRLDPRSMQQRSFDVGPDPRGVIVVDERVWVANSGDGTLTRLDPQTGDTRQVEVGGAPRKIAAEPDRLWISNEAGYVTALDLASEETSNIDLSGSGGPPEGVSVGEQVWVTTGAGNSLVAVAPAG